MTLGRSQLFSQVCCENFSKIFTALPRAAFRTKPNVYGGDFFTKIVNKLTFFAEKALPEMFDYVPKMPLLSETTIYHAKPVFICSNSAISTVE